MWQRGGLASAADDGELRVDKLYVCGSAGMCVLVCMHVCMCLCSCVCV